MTTSNPSRRSLLVGAGMSMVSQRYAKSEQSQFPPPGKAELTTPLKTHASRKGILYGGAALQRRLAADPEYAALFARQCGVLVPEGELKWNALRPSPESFTFGPADWLCDFTRAHNMKFRGHTLVWYQALPSWFGTYVTPGNAKRILEDHVSKVVGHYSGKMHSWDVVNEVVNPYDRRPDGLQAKPWLQLAGPEYIDLAFETARAADNNALLVWNENHLEINDTWGIAKRAALLALLKDKLNHKIPIDAVGLQSHLSTSDRSFNSPEFTNFVKAIADLGLKIILSELDVVDYDAPSSIVSRDQMVAQTYSDFLNSTLKHNSVIAVLTWSLSDKYSWLSKFKPREDGLPVRPLPFDDALVGKPAWTAMAHAFDDAPARQ